MGKELGGNFFRNITIKELKKLRIKEFKNLRIKELKKITSYLLIFLPSFNTNEYLNELNSKAL